MAAGHASLILAKEALIIRGFPEQPDWFRSIRDFPNIGAGLADIGFSKDEINGLMGLNWLRFYEHNFTPAVKS